jgi:hypothetical protein
LKELIEQTAKANGKKLEGVALNTPPRVTDEIYVLMEPHENHEGIYNSKDSGWYIDRISGAMTGENWRSEKNGDSHIHMTTTGKCSPIDIKANL